MSLWAAVVATGFYGVHEVTHELENPLGWDENDIDLTGFLTELNDALTSIHETVFGPPAAKVRLLVLWDTVGVNV